MRIFERTGTQPRHLWPIAISAILLCLLLGSGLQALSKLTPQDPLQYEPCEGCHIAGSQVSMHNAELLFSSQEQLCLNCHPGALKASHPSGLAPSMAIPADFPLDWKGDLTCSSCHNIHADAAVSLDKGHGSLRVEDTGKTFCGACHNPEFFLKMADTGSSLADSGHLDAQLPADDPQLDLYSARCMSCHEVQGEAATQLKIDTKGVARHDSGTNHPIGASYQKASAFGGYRAAALLPAQMLLPNGKVSCVSCHLGYTQQHGALVTSLSGSDLCYQCHDI